MDPSIELQQLRKTYGDFLAVDDVSLSVRPGEVCGLLGPNGAGKTTSIRMLMDIIAPDSGRVLFFGRPRTRAELSRVGYLPEERGLYRKMTVVDHLVFLGELRGLSRRQALPAIDSYLDRLELADWRKSKVEELSKGMQQKIQLIGTVLHDPEIVVLDEPFSGLDPINQGLFKDILSDFKARGKTILFSTHVMEQAEKLCDAIALIAHGRVVLDGNLGEIKRGFARRSYRLVARGDLTLVSTVAGIDDCLQQERYVRLLLAADVDSSSVLRRLVDLVD
ncbi:MAG: ATP-binding cassette domain-containing protein, partial [Acidobacteriota bacterium]|nr:ATP-binding cassette domain-containing protein [Acidobacteriota bacterium]